MLAESKSRFEIKAGFQNAGIMIRKEISYYSNINILQYKYKTDIRRIVTSFFYG